MLIENPDALKLWLTTKLGPLCDADPAALAKYVFALVKKDKPTVELRDSMIEQLEVFLQKETANFVELLFQTLESKSYLPAASAEVKTDIKPEDAAQNHAETSNGVLPNKVQQRKSESSDKEDRVLRRPRHRASPSPPPRGRSRSRSRSWDRSRRSRSRERLRRRKTPPRRRDRSWSRSKSPVRRSRSRSRTPIRHRRAYRSTSRSPLHESLIKKVTPNSGGATPTQDSNHGDVDMRLATTSQSIQSVISAPNNNNNNNNAEQSSALYKRRCRDFDEKGYCMRGDLCPYDHGIDPVVLEDMPLSSLGFPAGQPAGAMVPVAAPPLPGAVVPVRPPPPPLVQPLVMPEYSPDAPSMGSRVGWFRPGFRGHGRGSRGMPPRPPHMYVPPQRELISVPVSDNAVAPPDNFHEQPEHMEFNQRDGPSPAKKSTMLMQQQQQQHFDFSRLGPRKNPANCSLELKKVPRGLNNITHLNNHFSRFGKIVNIQVSYEGDPEAAIVTFSSHAEANAAYRSTEAVLNNRFIKVFWHNKKPTTNDGKQENVPPPSRLTIRDRLGIAPHSSKVLNLVQPRAVSLQSVVTVPNAAVAEPASQEDSVEEKVEKVIMSGNNLTKTVYIPTALKKQPDPALQENSKALATAAILKSQEILAAKETLKKKQEEKRKEAIKLTVNLRKRKQELIEMQLSQQKLLIERLEKGKTALKATEQKALMTTIKGLQESIEKIRKDLAPQQPAPPPPKKTKEEALKEILDAELDLFTRQQEGRESAELKKRVAELKLEAHSLGLLNPVGASSRGRGSARGRSSRGSFRGRGGRGAHAHTSVDHRPTRLLVSGHESDEWKDVLAHFAQFGEISDYTMDPQTPSLDLMFKTRKDAEAALIQGRNFRDRVLTVTWSLGHVVTPVAAVTPRSNKQQQAHEELQEEEEEDGETELIYEGDEELEIEEEEDDLEERSWRR